MAAAATARGIASQAEMGGLNASIVLPDADVESAAKVIAGAAMGYAGQKCTATGRVIVLGDPTPFTDALAAAVEALPTGDPADASTVVGPVINAPARDELVSAAQGAAADGGRVVTGGEALDGPGLFFTPAVIDGQEPTAKLAQEEVFGPIVTVLKAELGRAGGRDLQQRGLRAGHVGVHPDVDSALTVVDGLETGMIRVNMPTSGVDFHAPFGGEKQSSFGPREQGKAARELYTSTHTITVGPAGLSRGSLARPDGGRRAARARAARRRPGRAARRARSTRCSPPGRWTRRRPGRSRRDRSILAPVAGQEVWAAGVTYAASRTARNDESKGAHDFYDLVYDAERPELFFKAAPGRVRGPGGLIGVRADSGWDVPEPELALVISAAARDPRLHDRQRRLVALDRGREPALPAAGEGLPRVVRARPGDRAGRRGAARRRARDLAHDRPRRRGRCSPAPRRPRCSSAGSTSSSRWLFKAMDFPRRRGPLTGTSVIPAVEFTLRGGDEVRIAITGLGELVNTVEVV